MEPKRLAKSAFLKILWKNLFCKTVLTEYTKEKQHNCCSHVKPLDEYCQHDLMNEELIT
jgi:hypothetical protein